MKYLIEFTNHNASLVIEFNDEGIATSILLDHGRMTKEARKFLWDKFPFNLNRLEQYKLIKNVKVSEIQLDLSFDNFWNTYDYKHGRKESVEKHWNALDDINRTKALKYIYKYDKWLLDHPKTDKLYPQTFIKNQSWNN